MCKQNNSPGHPIQNTYIYLNFQTRALLVPALTSHGVHNIYLTPSTNQGVYTYTVCRRTAFYQNVDCFKDTAIFALIQTFIPSCAALIDATYPPGPEPITTRSTSHSVVP